MSKHSKNNNSSTVFTYQERVKMRGLYGTSNTRVSQDSIKPFEMCTLCNNILIEPMACDKGHLFCKTCVIEFLVHQKKKLADEEAEAERYNQRQRNMEREKNIEREVKKLEDFERYDGFVQITDRGELVGKDRPAPRPDEKQAEVKPVGVYELNPKKEEYVKLAFWTLENAPQHVEQGARSEGEKKKGVVCPGSDHRLTLKKLRAISLKQVEKEFLCWICSKEIKRQKVGAYKCGHLMCDSCKSQKCEICEQKEGWMSIESGCSSFAAHNKSEVKTYSHAFVC